MTYLAEKVDTVSRAGCVVIELILSHKDYQCASAIFSPTGARIAAQNLLDCADDADAWCKENERENAREESLDELDVARIDENAIEPTKRKARNKKRDKL